MERVRHLERRARHLGCDRTSGRSAPRSAAAGTVSRCPPTPTASLRACLSRRRSAGSATTWNQELFGAPTTVPWALEVYVRTPGGGPGTVPANGVCEFDTSWVKASPRGDLRHIPSDVPVRVALVPRRRRDSRLGRQALAARRRSGVRAVRGRLHPGPRVDRDAADRPGQPRVRPADQRPDLDRGVPRRGGLPGDQVPAAAADTREDPALLQGDTHRRRPTTLPSPTTIRTPRTNRRGNDGHRPAAQTDEATTTASKGAAVHRCRTTTDLLIIFALPGHRRPGATEF